MKKHKAAKEREENEFQYSGSDEDAPPDPDERAGEPSSILAAPGENTLRKNFQAIQDSTKAAQAVAEKNFSPKANQSKAEQSRRSSRKEESIPEPGPPSRPPIPNRLPEPAVSVPGPPPQRPLPPPPSGGQAGGQGGQRNSRLLSQPVTPGQGGAGQGRKAT